MCRLQVNLVQHPKMSDYIAKKHIKGENRT